MIYRQYHPNGISFKVIAHDNDLQLVCDKRYGLTCPEIWGTRHKNLGIIQSLKYLLESFDKVNRTESTFTAVNMVM